MATFANAAVDSLYKAKGSKALVKVKRSMGKDNIHLEPHYLSPHIRYIIQDSIHISLKKPEQWIEMEKNTAYSVCVNDSKGGFWIVNDFSYNKETDNCIQLYSGNFVKSGKIQYATKMGNGYTFHLLVGMKYIDLRGEKLSLGYFGPEFKREKNVLYLDPRSDFENRNYPDSLRFENIDKILSVDKYKVTECEFVQTLWDSIPNQARNDLLTIHNYWIKKKNSLKNGHCDSHDSAAVRISPYLALVYANLRSLRDGLKPVYTFEESSDWKTVRLFDNGNFGIEKRSFNDSYRDDFEFYVIVHIDKSANGYRLPYYDEWMALARGGESNQHYDMTGLVCESVMLPGKSIFNDEILTCKGGFLPDSLKSHDFIYHGLRLVRQIK